MAWLSQPWVNRRTFSGVPSFTAFTSWRSAAASKGSAAAPRHTLHLTGAGRTALLDRLRAPEPLDISDGNRWTALVSFLRHLDDPAAQAAVLRRRIAFLSEPASFFYEGDRPRAAEEFTDPFRRGLLLTARATTEAELSWLRAAVDELSG